MLKNHKFPATLQLMDLPDGFNVIVGIDWMTRHNCRPQVRARTILIEHGPNESEEDGDRPQLVVAGCGAITIELSTKESTFHIHIRDHMCHIQDKEKPVRAYDNNVSHIEFKEGPEWDRDYQGIKTHAHSAIQKSNAKTRKVQACGYVMCNFHEAIAAITAKKKGLGESHHVMPITAELASEYFDSEYEQNLGSDEVPRGCVIVLFIGLAILHPNRANRMQ